MSKVTAAEYVGLDGVVEAPQWTAPFWSEDLATAQKDLLFANDALLLGRVTYEGFAAAWPSMTDEAGFAERMNSMPKHVATRTLTDLEWNATALPGDAVDAVRELKERGDDTNYLIYGSPTLVNALLPHGLVDEYRLMTFPVVVGSGRRLFDEGPAATLRLVDSWMTTTGVAMLSYAPAVQ
ncbi:MAG: dihydrofolate reductase family protein [Frankiaceae bacterium]